MGLRGNIVFFLNVKVDLKYKMYALVALIVYYFNAKTNQLSVGVLINYAN